MITSTGLCFTCNHVIDNAKEIYVRLDLAKDKREVYKASIKYQNEGEDFAILQLDDCKNNYFYEIEMDYDSLAIGDDVAIYGYPFGAELNDSIMELEPSLTKGYIASKNKILGHTCYYLDIRSAPGNSGGPVFLLKNNRLMGYLCGSYGSDRANLIYIRTMKYFIKNMVRE